MRVLPLLLHIHSFKERGARYRLERLSIVSCQIGWTSYIITFSPLQEERRRGVISASAGNHASAMAYHGQQLKIRVTMVTPINAPLVKVTVVQTLDVVWIKVHYTVKKRVLPQHLLGCSYACLNTTPLGCYIGCCECTHRVL